MQDTQITYQSKAMSYLLYFTAIILSAVSGYYSIAGLAAIFAAALIPIVVMGVVLEFAKLVVASWLFNSWKNIPWLMKTYFTFALIILMALTSMGIFGFLSKAHLDQSVPTSDVAAKISGIDEKIKTERENIESSRKALKQMDETIDQTIARSKTDQGAVNANAMRTRQAKERTQIQSDITKAQGEIAKLNNERAPIASELRKVEAEVGPIKYIAALIYGDNPDQTILEKAVRIVIIMIVIVFDPLAVLLLMAAGMPVLKRKENDTRNQTSSEEVRTEETTQTSPSIIKERFVTKFAERPKEPYVGQQLTSSSEPSTVDDRRSARPSSDTNSSGTSAGVTTRTEDLSTEQNKVSVWDVNSGKEIDYDSIGRRITPPIPGELLETKQKTIEVEVEELQTDKKV
jgi:hypothetical protein